jgi:dephospho-CoA kinase
MAPRAQTVPAGANAGDAPDGRARRLEIVLIGPQGAGKTMVGKLLAERLGVPWAEMDAVCRRLATLTVYTKDKRPEETRDEILARAERSRPGAEGLR